MGKSRASEGLKTARLLMVLSGLTPLFVLWAIQGVILIRDSYLWAFCLVMVLVPNLFLWGRIKIAKKQRDVRELVMGPVEDHRDHLLVYLFTMLLPFYSTSLSSWRSVVATLAALSFVIFLFWHLNLHYMNIFFAIFGYRVCTVHPPGTGPYGSTHTFVVITKSENLAAGDRRVLYRISDTVYFEGV